MSSAVSEPLVSYIKNFSKATVLVVGDLMIDEFIYGRAERISPEAPVPVVNVVEKRYRLGGAANVLNNIHALNGKGFLCGVVGNDEMGNKFTGEIKRLGATAGGIVSERGRPTTVKTRIIADQRQQVVRYDQEVRKEITHSSRNKMLRYLKDKFKSVNALIISDYAKGVISAALLKELLPLAKKRKILICADHPKLNNHTLYEKHASIITPNKKEASRVSGIEIESEIDLVRAGKKLLASLACDAVLITRGEEGMTLFEKRKGVVTHIPFPTKAKEVYDVTGAGDTVIATLAMALAVGASKEEAARISNHAAGIVVSKLGTATATPEELIENIREDPF
jgi:D-beta-D-heptose 7-phosphate kinase/D-beta-D-heptose 1-phosphate adenosyltransferase